MSDTPELGRLSVLMVAVINHLLEAVGVDRSDQELAPILKEADALVMRVAHRSRSAIRYDETKRGQAALNDLRQAMLQVRNDELKEPGQYVELVDYTWTPEQLGGPIMPGMQPERKITRRAYVGGLQPMSKEFNPTPTS